MDAGALGEREGKATGQEIAAPRPVSSDGGAVC